MRNLTIRQLEEYSGIKSHTIRMWEQRYRIFSPTRNANNRRTYTVDELKKLLDITLLNKRGIKISHLSRYTDSDIAEKVLLAKTDSEQLLVSLHQLFVFMNSMNPEAFEMTLDNCFFLWPAAIVMAEVIFVFLQRSKLLWEGNSVAEEHFAVTSIRKKLISVIEKTTSSADAQKTVLLFLPHPSQLDLGLLYINYLLKKHGHNVLYMGTGVSFSNLEIVFKSRRPEYIFTHLPSKTKFKIDELCGFSMQHLPGSTIIVITPHSIDHKNAIVATYDDAIKILLG